MFRVNTSYFGMLVGIGLFSVVGCGKSGPVKHKVTGTVLVNDKPASSVCVCLRHTSDAVKGKARMPVAVTDENGVYTLSTDTDADGAVDGEYVVTFLWMDSKNPDTDRFGGKYADTNSSPYRLKVPPPNGQVEPFKLQHNPKGGK